jgi:RNA polymerase primary sigma factor
MRRSSSRDEKTYQALRAEIVQLVNELHLHNNRIEALIDQLYGINRRIMSIDSADGEARRPGADQPARIHRRLSRRRARPDLAGTDGESPGRGWQAFVTLPDKVEELRAEMAQVGQYVGLDIEEFRRIVNQVQKGEKEARIRPRRKWSRPTCAW